jgi:hypothetical protein
MLIRVLTAAVQVYGAALYAYQSPHQHKVQPHTSQATSRQRSNTEVQLQGHYAAKDATNAEHDALSMAQDVSCPIPAPSGWPALCINLAQTDPVRASSSKVALATQDMYNSMSNATPHRDQVVSTQTVNNTAPYTNQVSS